MKTFRIFKLSKIALIAIIICINFVGCSLEDSTETITSEKKITRMIVSNDDPKSIYITEFNYDKNGKLISHREIDGITEEIKYTFKYIWSNDSIIVTEPNKNIKQTYLIDNGLVQKYYKNDEYDKYNAYHTYNYNLSNKVVRHKYSWAENDDTATWDGDKLISNSSTRDMTGLLCKYTNSLITYEKPCKKGYFPLMYDLLYNFFDIYDKTIFIAHPEIAGIRTMQLPINYTHSCYNQYDPTTNYYEYEYEFNDTGYISKIVEKCHYSDTWIDTTYYSFTWE